MYHMFNSKRMIIYVKMSASILKNGRIAIQREYQDASPMSTVVGTISLTLGQKDKTAQRDTLQKLVDFINYLIKQRNKNA